MPIPEAILALATRLGQSDLALSADVRRLAPSECAWADSLRAITKQVKAIDVDRFGALVQAYESAAQRAVAAAERAQS